MLRETLKFTSLCLFLALVACGTGNSQKSKTDSSEKDSTSISQLQTIDNSLTNVLYFHGKQRCATCVAIGTEAAELVAQLADEGVAMVTIDFSTPEGEKIADSYEIASSSLIVVKDGKVDNLTAMSFQYARNNPEVFKENLREAVQKIAQ
ncbi:MAG: nitrophenyl compound nitroreductase subunit ArsF family protein [Rikenellaceae bacterium]